MPCPDIAGIYGIIVEILARQGPRFIADQPVFRDRLRVELDLDFDVLGDGHQRATHLLDQNLACFGIAVDIGSVAVSGLGEQLHD